MLEKDGKIIIKKVKISALASGHSQHKTAPTDKRCKVGPRSCRSVGAGGGEGVRMSSPHLDPKARRMVGGWVEEGGGR